AMLLSIVMQLASEISTGGAATGCRHATAVTDFNFYMRQTACGNLRASILNDARSIRSEIFCFFYYLDVYPQTGKSAVLRLCGCHNATIRYHSRIRKPTTAMSSPESEEDPLVQTKLAHTRADRLVIHNLVKRDPLAGFAEDVRCGLTSVPRRLFPKYLYDELGSQLFDAICLLPEYYLTRAENEILTRFAPEIVRSVDCPTTLIEMGSGSASKT